MSSFIYWFDELSDADAASVGGKNAALGEMTRSLARQGVRVPGGFAMTAEAYHRFLAANSLQRPIEALLRDHRAGRQSLEETGRALRRLFARAPLPAYIAEGLRAAYRTLSVRYAMTEADVAVRSSATAPGHPNACFAGQQESFLNVRGEDELLDACRRCYASLFTDRAIEHRAAEGLSHTAVALSVGVQKMVRADRAGAGVLSTLDAARNGADVIVINASWGLGENVVRGIVAPDEYTVFKLSLQQRAPAVKKRLGAKQQKLIYAPGGSRVTRNVPTTPEEQRRFVLCDAEALELARWSVQVEQHYGRPVQIEWAKDGETGELFIVQAALEAARAAHPGVSLSVR